MQRKLCKPRRASSMCALNSEGFVPPLMSSALVSIKLLNIIRLNSFSLFMTKNMVCLCLQWPHLGWTSTTIRSNQTPLTNRVTVVDTVASHTESYEMNLPAQFVSAFSKSCRKIVAAAHHGGRMVRTEVECRVSHGGAICTQRAVFNLDVRDFNWFNRLVLLVLGLWLHWSTY